MQSFQILPVKACVARACIAKACIARAFTQSTGAMLSYIVVGSCRHAASHPTVRCQSLTTWSVLSLVPVMHHSTLPYMLSMNTMCAYRQVAVLCFIKFSGALVWGAADILQVKYSEMPIMQSLGDGPQTLGLVFASVGVGCFFGPILFNWFTPPRYALLDYRTLSAGH